MYKGRWPRGRSRTALSMTDTVSSMESAAMGMPPISDGRKASGKCRLDLTG